MSDITVMNNGNYVYPPAFLLKPQYEIKHEFLISAMLTAHHISTLSHCVRRKAGAVVVAMDEREMRPRVLGWGVNGMPPGQDNCCELPAPEGHVAPEGDPHPHLVTNPAVLHAEIRAIDQAVRTGVDTRNMYVLCTDSPCPDCASYIDQVGIPHVYFMFDYHAQSHLRNNNFRLYRIKPESVLGVYTKNHDHLCERIKNGV